MADDLRAMFQEYESQGLRYAKEVAKARVNARGILKPEVIQSQIDKKQGIVLAYGMSGEVKYTLSELKRFLSALDNFQKQSHLSDSEVQGVPYAKLLYASRATDIERSKQVRTPTLYQREGNIIYFHVTGNSRPFYRVMIRLEEWNKYIANAIPVLAAINSIIQGRISFECPCGRHQYWYRYMATLGHYAIEPLETGFPKIRNPALFGCCCKHVLKVLKELQNNRVKFILCKELEKERKKPGFSSNKKAKILSNKDLRLAQARKLSRDAAVAFKKYEKEAQELKKKLKPRPKAPKKLLAELRLTVALANSGDTAFRDAALNNFAKLKNMSRADVDALIKENNL